MIKEQEILTSWETNSNNWIQSIDNNEIESRQLVTNQAIVDIITKYQPQKVLDLACGEGWLTRTLNKSNIYTFGVDGTTKLVSNAKLKGKGEFAVCTYQEIIDGKTIKNQPFDAIVINFGLFEDKNTEKLLSKLKDKLTYQGKIFIQTLHPFYKIQQSQAAYIDTWEDNAWTGLKGDYTKPFKWHNRTLESWINMFIKLNYTLLEIKEPLNPQTKKPQSIIFVIEK